jgi:hypothetical protein
MRFWVPILSLLLLSGCIIGSGLNITDKDLVGKPNLLANGDFETVSNAATPPGWMALARSDQLVAARADSSNTQQGRYALRVKGQANPIWLYSEDIPVQSRSLYYCRLWVRSSGPDQLPVTLKVAAFDATGNCVDAVDYRYVPRAEWFRMEVNTGLFKKTAVSARVIVGIPSGAKTSYWLDDAAPYEVYQVPYTRR